MYLVLTVFSLVVTLYLNLVSIILRYFAGLILHGYPEAAVGFREERAQAQVTLDFSLQALTLREL